MILLYLYFVFIALLVLLPLTKGTGDVYQSLGKGIHDAAVVGKKCWCYCTVFGTKCVGNAALCLGQNVLVMLHCVWDRRC